MECRATQHRNRSPRVMGEHEHQMVIWRVVTPPAFPLVVRPLAPGGPEHVSADDRGAYAGVTPRGGLGVEDFVAALLSDHSATVRGLGHPPGLAFTALRQRGA